jgi:hypothetical protein
MLRSKNTAVSSMARRMVAVITTIRTVFGTALSLHHTQRARLRQRPTRRKRVLVKPNSRIEVEICATCWSLCVRAFLVRWGRWASSAAGWPIKVFEDRISPSACR